MNYPVAIIIKPVLPHVVPSIYEEVEIKEDSLMKLKIVGPSGVVTHDGNVVDELLKVRSHGNLRDSSFLLDSCYDWQIVRDSSNLICLVPTKKK